MSTPEPGLDMVETDTDESDEPVVEGVTSDQTAHAQFESQAEGPDYEE